MKYENYCWSRLPKDAKDAAQVLGYTPKMWNNDQEPEEKEWDELNSQQQKAAITLGYTQEIWDDDDSNDFSVTMNKYQNYSWNKLPKEAKDAAQVLGYTSKIWDNDLEPTEDKEWNDLTSKQQEAAKILGMTPEIWNFDGKKINLLCLQIYIETNDYILIDKKDMGISMIVNRTMDADERFFQSPTGPQGQEQYLCYSQKEGMSNERHEFALRFLEWQSKYGNENENEDEDVAVGASKCECPIFTLQDFEYNETYHHDDALSFSPKDTDSDDDDNDISNNTKNHCYYFTMQPQDYVLVEFITGPNNSQEELPPRRQFEILPYNEAIYWDGEIDYDPKCHKRPPSLDNIPIERSLEIPSQFSNHACGSSATVYDTFRLSKEGEEGTLAAPAQSLDFQAYLRTLTNDDDDDDDSKESMCWGDERNVMTAHKALCVGDEVLTDYILWHWCNENYDDGSEPWFHCICGNSKCHSSKGFRGVRFLPLEEQKRLYWVCSEWIQNQMDWKLYQIQSNDYNNEDDDNNKKEKTSTTILKYENYDWKKLPKDVKDAAKVLGFTPKMWNNDIEPKEADLDWKELTSNQQKAALTLGYTQEIWDNDDDDSDSSNDEDNNNNMEKVITIPKYENCDWKKLPKDAKDAAKVLGFTPKMWNNDIDPDLVADLDWKELNSKQQKSAVTLGYNQEFWDKDDN